MIHWCAQTPCVTYAAALAACVYCPTQQLHVVFNDMRDVILDRSINKCHSNLTKINAFKYDVTIAYLQVFIWIWYIDYNYVLSGTTSLNKYLKHIKLLKVLSLSQNIIDLVLLLL